MKEVEDPSHDNWVGYNGVSGKASDIINSGVPLDLQRAKAQLSAWNSQ